MPVKNMSENRQKEYSQVLAMAFKGETHAISLCLQLNALSQTIDDLIDKDNPVTDEGIFLAFHTALFDLQENPFFDCHRHKLRPVLKSAYLAWYDSARLEQLNEYPQDRSSAYVLRDQSIDVAIACAQIIGGTKHAIDSSIALRRFWTKAETFDQYNKEFED